MKLSVAMMIKNEERNLIRTLNPLKKLSEIIDVEIIIIDNGSTDNSISIAKEYTEKVYVEEWKDDFSYMRNKTIEKCSGDYILVLDADEELVDVEKLADFIKLEKLENDNSAYISIINYNGNKEKSLLNGSENRLQRLFKTKKVSYEGRIHEQPICSGNIKNTEIRFIHYGYDENDYELMEHKYKRNIELLMKDLEENPENIYINFQVATSFHIYNKIDEALKYIEIAYKLVGEKINEYIYVIQKYCEILYEIKNYKKLKELAEIGLRFEKEFSDLYFYLGISYNEEKELEKALNNLENFIKCNKINISNKRINLINKFKGSEDEVYIILVTIYNKMKLKEKAYENLLKIRNKNLIKSNIKLSLDIIINYNSNNMNFLNEVIDGDVYEFILNYIKTYKFEVIKLVDENLLEGKIKEIICIFKRVEIEKKSYSKVETINLMKEIIKRDEVVYTFYLEYLLENNINNINFFKKFNHKEISYKIKNICKTRYDILGTIIDNIENLSEEDLNEINFKTYIIKALILSEKLNEEKSNILFKELIALKYYSIINIYNKNIIENYFELINEEDRFFIDIKKALSLKYKDELKYIKEISKINKQYKLYLNELKYLINEKFEVNKNNFSLLNEIKININNIIGNESYQEAHEVSEEVLKVVGFDYDVAVIKYDLLNRFGYYNEANKLLKSIILYSDIKDLEKFL